MKKIALLLSVLLALAVVFAAVPALAVEIPPEASFFGDADLDGAVRANDARLILRHAAKVEMLTSQTALILADMDGNEKISAADARLALRVASRLDPLRKGERPGASTDPTDQPATDEATTTPPDTLASTTQAAVSEQVNTSDATAEPTSEESAESARNAELLAEFGEVMRVTKAQVRAFSLTEWDELNELDLGSFTSLAGGVAQEYIDEALRAKDDAAKTRSADPEALPPYGALPDASAILSSEKRDNGDGTVTITLILKDEKDPAPYERATGRCASAAGRLFPVADRSDVDFTVMHYAAKIPYASAELTGLTYSGCTISCTYDAATGRAVSILRRAPVRADVQMRAVVLKINGRVSVTVCSDYDDFRYDGASEPTTARATEPTTVEPTEPTPVEPTEPTPVEPTEPTTTRATEPTTVAPPAGQGETLSKTNAEILAKYKEVMDNTKKTVKTYDKLDWMTLSAFDVGSVTNIVRSVIDDVIQGEDKAELQDDRDDAGKQIPPVNSAGVGCGLTDAVAVKSARWIDNGDGTATITITLNDERNSEPMDPATGACSSAVGGIFPCMSRTELVKTLDSETAQIPGASVQELQLDYKNCTVVMTFDKAANHATEVEYTAPCYITGAIKVVVAMNLSACMENHVRINDMKY
ncbi:MAG: hypothetical protein IJK23_13925 [Clostridia bacterium]|nr:hypothetical protein [Clostridia bacterium]